MDFDSIYKSLILKLYQTKNLLGSTALNMEVKITDKNQKVQFAENLLKEHDLMPDYDPLKLTKCNQKAEEFKNLGNQLYKNEKVEEALVSYNKSLCYSPEDSQDVGIAFANRSAVYFEMGQYDNCIENIELAKNHNYPKEKIDKLNERKKKALEKLKYGIHQQQNLVKYEAAREKFLKPKLKAKENFDFFVADCLEVKTSPEFGRHLITNEDLKVGSVIAVEKVFSKIVEPGAIYERCANCLRKNWLNLLPCFNCCSVMFCSEDCRSAAQEKFHKYECGLMHSIDEIFKKSFSLPMRTYFEALHICGSPSKLREFLNSIKDSNATILDFDYTDESSFQKNRLHSIDSLVTVEKSPHRCGDLFGFCIACAILCNLMLNYSEPLKALLVDDADKDFFREFIFKYSQISSMNFSGLFNITTSGPERNQYGSGSLSFCSSINHSCDSNVVRISIKDSCYFIVHRPIKKGQQIFDDYGYHLCRKPREERQKELLRLYGFICDCQACKNDYPMYESLEKKSKNILKDCEKLSMQDLDLDVAIKNYSIWCKLIDKLDEKDYPSYEICTLQDMVLRCVICFSVVHNET